MEALLVNTQTNCAASCNSRPGLRCLAPRPSLASVSNSSRRVKCEAWSELIAFADVVDPNMTLPMAASVLAYYLMPYYQNYGPADPSSIAAESKEEEAVRKAEYSLYQPKPAKKAIRRGGLKHAHGTQHLRLKSHAWHS